MFTKSLIAAGLAGLVLSAQPAAAQSAQFDAGASQPAQRMVRYADLDLTTTAGQTQFESRLRRAATSVCGANYGPHPLNEAMEARRCYRNALQSAHQQMAMIGGVRMVSR